MPFSAIGTGTNPFIIEVDTSKAGSANDAFQFTGAVGDYDVVAKQSGVIVQTFSNLSGQETITLSNGTGIYILEVTPKATGGFNRINFNNGGDKLKLTDVKRWGNIVSSSFERSFFGCSNSPFTDTNAPNLSIVTNMNSMFRDATVANPNVFLWDVSSVTNMTFMFFRAIAANPQTANWNVSNVTNMNSMFKDANSANPNTTNWDVSNVGNMQQMFQASGSNPDVSLWNVSNVSNMRLMFGSASIANPDMRNWDVSNVGTMQDMLSGANLSTDNLDGCYTNWSQLTLRQNVSFSAGTTKFSAAAQAGRDILVNTYNWTITDGGVV